MAFDFREDWFSENIPIWTRLLAEHRGKPSLRYLEIGVFEGRSTCWLLENILTCPDARIECIDNFEGGMNSAPAGLDMTAVRQRFESNAAPWQDKLTLHVGTSAEILPTLTNKFDFVYIDGSHQAKDVLTDSVYSWYLLKPNGIIIFDDYEWDIYHEAWRNPKLAIQSFLRSFTGWYQVLHVGYQVAIRKLAVYAPPTVPASNASRPA